MKKRDSQGKKIRSPKKTAGNTPFYLGLKSKAKPVKKKAVKQERFIEQDDEQPRFHRPIKRKSMLDDAFSRSILLALPERPDNDTVHHGLEPLAEYPYMTEQMVKVSAFTEFWTKHNLQGEILPLIPSPKPRAYRATTRRKVFFNGHSLMLGFGDQQSLTFPKKGVMSIAKSSIEPEDHYTVYELIGKKLLTKPYQELSNALNFLIIRDTGEKAVIFNVAELNGEIVRKLKMLGEMLAKTTHKIVSAWVYHDPTRSEYYLDQKSLEPGTMRIKKLFGFDELSLTINDIKFRVSPFTFSQVNVPMMKMMVGRMRFFSSPGIHPGAKEGMKPEMSPGINPGGKVKPGVRLIDLYCGYGLFSHALADMFSEVHGIDSSKAGIESAKQLVERRKKIGHDIGSMHFKEAFITKSTMLSHLPHADETPEVILLDPPRQGTADGVIAAIAKRNPMLVIHVFCAINEIEKAMREWKKNGYVPVSAQALDMFPGTPTLETIVVLKPLPSKYQ
jgi:tRNA/tmRNA/rRNA uracil-C5-methylase (TrmA/RlmC/RlmD family)